MTNSFVSLQIFGTDNTYFCKKEKPRPKIERTFENEIDKIEQMFYNIGKSKDDKIFHKGRNLNGTDAKRLL